MTSILKRSSPYLVTFFPFISNNSYDSPVDKKYLNADVPTSGLERLRNMFQKDENGVLTPELQYCIHVSTLGLIVGGFYGGVVNGRGAFVKFIDNNEATMFRNHLDAKRKLQDVVTLGVGKGAFQWAWRTFFFTSVYGFTATMVSVFRGQSGILEHIDAGIIAGAVYNMKNGIRGAIVGAGLGCFLGSVFGTLSYGLLLLSGKTMEDIRFYTYEWKKQRDELISDVNRKHRIKKDEEEILNFSKQFSDDSELLGK